MKIFAPAYRRIMVWSRHPHGERYLAAVSFAESSLFPIPTSIMLAPMVLARPERAWRLAAIATLSSVLGGLFGYLIGYAFYEEFGAAIIAFYGATERFATMDKWFDDYGVWAVLLSGITPIPYKVFTLAAGVFGLPLLGFVAASVVGRAVQFYLVAAVLWWGGAAMQPTLERHMERIGWGLLVVAVAGYWWLTR